MGAARRAAIYASLTSEPELSPFASDASAVDHFCALYAAIDRARVPDAALAAACADVAPNIAAISRVLLQTRSLVRDAVGLPARKDTFAYSSAVAGIGATAASSLEEAISTARNAGVRVLEVPRALLRAIGGDESDGARILRAAFSNEDGDVVRALAGEFDVAELQAASRLAGQKSLRSGLPTAGAAFRGGAARERALECANRLEKVRACARKKHGAVRAAVETLGVDDDVLAREAASADAVWDRLDEAPPLPVRIAVLLDAIGGRRLDGDLTLRPHGSSESDAAIVRLTFGQSPASSAIDAGAFAQALQVDAASLTAPGMTITGELHEIAALWLERAGTTPAAYNRPTPEQPSRVTAPAMTFSASRLNVFAKCPRRFFYEYMCNAVDEKTTANAVYGKVFHAALEALHRDVRDPALWEAPAVLDRLSGLLDASFGQSRGEFASQLEYEVLRLRARQVAQHYVRWLYEEAADAPLEIVEIESRQALLLGGHRFVGYIDRIDRPPGGGAITIFDYKTGRVEDDPEEYLRQVRDGEEAQLALYYAMRRAQGDDVARIALVSIRDARAKTWILALDIADASGKTVVARADRRGVLRATCSVEDLERSLGELVARCDSITRDGFEHFAVGEDPPCSYCSYAAACRERPSDGERIFAR